MHRWLIFLGFVFLSCNKDPLFDCFENAGDKTHKILLEEAFQYLCIDDVFNVYLIQDTVCRLEAEGGSNVLESIDVQLVDGRLTIRNNARCSWVRGYEKVSLFVHYAGLTELYVGQACYVKTVNPMVDNILMGVGAGYSEVDMNFNCTKFYFYNNGHTGGHFIFSGYSRLVDLYGYGSCMIEADSLLSERMVVSNSSIADFRVRSDNEFFFSILNLGNIHLTGHPQSIDTLAWTGTGRLILEE